MSSLTIHALDQQLADTIRQRARDESISMNELVKRILAEGLGIKVPAEPPHRREFAAFHGTWTAAEAEEFGTRVAGTEQVDPGDWQ
jgi:plasmid stability protein